MWTSEDTIMNVTTTKNITGIVSDAGASVEDTVQLLRGLADPNRLRIINLLLHRDELCVCDIERVLEMTQTKVSRHLTILRHARLVRARREGRWMHYRLQADSDLKHALFTLLRESGCCVSECTSDLEALRDGDSCAAGEVCA